jgi:hypothetical protein
LQTTKIFTLLVVLFLCMPFVLATSTIELSTDNSTWKNANIVSVDNIASVVGLQCNTIYYFRITEGAGYEYDEQKTKSCGLSEMEIAILIFFGILVIVFGTLTVTSSSVGMKSIWGLVTGLVIVIGLNVTAKLAESTATNSAVVNVLWTTYRVSLYLYITAFLFVMVALMALAIVQRQKQPSMGSPLQDSHFMKK